MMKNVNYGKCSRGMLFLCFSTWTNLHHVLKSPPSAYMRVLTRECHWSMDASIVCCSMVCLKCLSS